MLRLRTPVVAAASALVALGLVCAPAAANAATVTTTAAAATASPDATASPAATTSGADDGVTVGIAPAADGVLRPDESLKVAVTVTNHGDEDLPQSESSLHIVRSVEADRDDLSDWIDNTSTDGYLGIPIRYFEVPALKAHQSVTVKDVEVDPVTVGLGAYTSFGARRIAVDYSAGGESAVGRSAVTWYPSQTSAPTGVSVAMPITAPVSAGDVTDRNGLLSASELTAMTAVDGTLTQQLEAARGHNVAIGIDPRIIASIRILGENAPSSATNWLDDLQTGRNETFALSWADADVTGLRQAGADGILSPISLDQQVDPDDFPGASTPTPTPTGPTATATPGATSTATSTPTADPTGQADQGSQNQDDDQPQTLPTTATLLDFPYTLSNVAWPTDDSVTGDDLAALRDAKTRTIVSSGNTSAGTDTTVGAAETIGGASTLVSDETMSDMLRRAATATDDQDWASAMTELTATLATASRQGTTTAPILLTLGRDWPSDSARLTQTLDALEGTAWVSPTDLSTAASASPGTLTVRDQPEADDRIEQLRSLVDTEKRTTDFSTAITTPTDVTAPQRLRTLALASNSWRSNGDDWTAAVTKDAKRADRLVNTVGIVDSSNINLYADRSSLPISVRNKSDFPVTVVMRITPSNSALRVEKNALKVAVAADSQTRITFPVQSVANGKVDLTMSLASETGVRIADPSTVEINVQAQWESIITGAAAAAVVLIFGLGILRNVRRRLRRKREGLPPEDEPDPNRPLETPSEDVASATATDRPGGSSRVDDATPALGMAGSATALAAGPAADAPTDVALATAGAEELPEEETRVPDGDRLEDAIARAGAVTSLQADPETTTEPAEPDADVATTKGLGKASALLAAGTMVSRVLGFVKTFVLAAAIGQASSPSANAFALSNQLPNNIYALIAGGLLSAVLIPQIVRAMRNHSDGGQTYVNRIITLGGSLFVVITIVATLLAPWLVRLYSQQAADGGKGFDQATTDLAVAFAFWCLPQILFYALYSLLGEVLNARQVFGPFTWAPLLNNVIAIGGLIVFMALFGGRTENTGTGDWTPLKIAVLAGSATFGVFVQAAFLPFFLKRAGLTFRLDFRLRGVGLRSTGTAAGWLFLMILTTQLAGLVQSRVATLGNEYAGNAVLANTWLLFMLPHSIITVSIATAYFTRMSHDAERGDLAAVRRNLSLSLRIVGLFTVFATVAFIVVAFPFARIYERQFEDVQTVAFVLFAYMPGLVLFSMLFIIQRVFWALHDHRTPFLMQLVQSVLFVAGALAVATFPGQLIGVGIAATTTLAGTAQTIVALVLVKRRLGGIEGAVVTRSHAQFVIAALIAGVAGVLVVNFFGAFEKGGFAVTDITSALITIVLAGAVMVIVYFGALVVAKNAEIRSAVDLVRGRLGR